MPTSLMVEFCRQNTCWVAGMGITFVAILGCSQPEPRKVGREILSDPQVFALDYTAPSNRFDGAGGSLMLTSGWAPAEKGRQPADTPFFSWVLESEASIAFLRPPTNDLLFFARATPFTWQGAPAQTMTLILNGQPITTLPMTAGWNEYRAVVPRAALEDGLNTLLLKFAYSSRPSEVSESTDRRSLSAAFSDIALIPAKAENPWVLLDTPRFDESAGWVEIPPWGGFSLPLPVAQQIQLSFGAMDGECLECILTVELTAPGLHNQVLWSGEAAWASGLDLSFETFDTRVTFLGVRIVPTRGPDRRHDSKLLIQLPRDFLTFVPTKQVGAREKPPIFIYLVDTLRADALEIYGSHRPTSPNISDFSELSVSYQKAWAPSSWTLPSVASLLTGLYPSRHGLVHGNERLSPDEVRSMARYFSDLGYQTFGISQSFVTGNAFQLDAGFDRFLLSNQLNGWSLRSQETRCILLALLATATPDRPVFTYIHTVDPHAPYAPQGSYRQFARETSGSLGERLYRPRPFVVDGHGNNPDEVEHLRALYEGEVLHTDEQFGRFIALLEHLSLLDDGVVVLVSDHGEEFGDHRGFDHGRTLYEELLHVPLLIKYPGSKWAGTRVDERVSLLDLLPTLLHEVGFDTGDLKLDGRVIRPDILSISDSRPVFAETNPRPNSYLAGVDLQAMAIGQSKCIHTSTGLDQFSQPLADWQVFDLASDPRESLLLDAVDPRTEDCIRGLNAWLHSRSNAAQIDSKREPVNEETLENMRALGYIQ